MRTLASYLPQIYQLGYVTNDIEAAVAHYQRRLGVREFARLTTDGRCLRHGEEAPFRIHVALANVGDRQIELIQPLDGPVRDFYARDIDLTKSVAVLHHYGVLVPGPETEWAVMKAVVGEAGYALVLEDAGAPGRSMHFAYADTRADYGHYVEFLWRGPEAQAWHESLPDQARAFTLASS